MKAMTLLITVLFVGMLSIGCGSSDSQAGDQNADAAPVTKPESTEEPTMTQTSEPATRAEEPVAQAEPEPEPAKPSISPDTYDPNEPIPADVIHEAFYANKDAWLGKEVTVIGYYKGSTHSSATDQTRVDLKADRLSKTFVGAMIPGKGVTPKSAVADREGIIMKGKITHPFFGQVILENAVFLNRE